MTLLFLDEVDSFWFLVACVEHLQPAAYYTPTLHCAVADQRVSFDQLVVFWKNLIGSHVSFAVECHSIHSVIKITQSVPVETSFFSQEQASFHKEKLSQSVET